MSISFRSIQLTVTSANISELLFKLNLQGIPLHHLRQSDELTASFCVYQHRYSQAVSIIDSAGGKIEYSVPASGIVLVKSLLRRPILLFIWCLMLALTIYLPTRVLFISVTGNDRLHRMEILEAAADSGIHFGAARHELRSEKVKNRLLSALPELKWVGVNTKGCVAYISVCERTLPRTKLDEPMVSSLVAARDGVIREMTVVSGNPICRVGQAVTKGQLLVSGYSDCGRCIYGTKAEAEVYAQTRRSLEMCMVTDGLERGAATLSRRKYGLLIGKKRINFYKGSGISDTTCVRMYMEYPFTLPGGFRLPLALTVQEETTYDTSAADVNIQDTEEILNAFAMDYLESQMIAGKVERGDYQITKADGVLNLIGQYICNEMIGQIRSEEIINNYGQTN